MREAIDNWICDNCWGLVSAAAVAQLIIGVILFS